MNSPSGYLTPNQFCQLYGLFKWLTVSPSPNTSRPSLFDLTGRAKWDAWNAAGQKYSNGADVEKRYLDIARELGWSPGAPVEDTDDTDSDHSLAMGLGHTVSVMSMNTEEAPDDTIHGFAIANDVDKVKKLLLKSPDADLNEKDEFGYTCLHLAADRGNVDIVKFLLHHGADTTLKDDDDFTAAELARIAGHHNIADILSNP
ncbi:hypothetical protein D9758_000373 [Tetrapyrgos nigripes]|uniref:ACB domain-containing protein n=1 Tax=Tetrapyrgos nigripes TaxID=182062 RepID=A0A8H5LYV8_9AGAR|nr:hypothetical protein D9758_000373 [Tetrapyrgos nigripes]